MGTLTEAKTVTDLAKKVKTLFPVDGVRFGTTDDAKEHQTIAIFGGSGEKYYKEDEYYEYTLKGVTVHIGTADGGHYFSYINVNRERGK